MLGANPGALVLALLCLRMIKWLALKGWYEGTEVTFHNPLEAPCSHSAGVSAGFRE